MMSSIGETIEDNVGWIITGILGSLAAICFAYLLATSDSAEVKSYNWAKSFCGGKDTDISDYRYIIRGQVTCKDGRQVTVPL